MQEHQVTLTESEWDVVIKGIHNLYLKYGGYYEDDEVYNYNSELDEVLHNIKKQIEEAEVTKQTPQGGMFEEEK